MSEPPEAMAPPVWVIGSPRSGTTFLARVMDTHPLIFLTNETRLMLLVNQFLTQLPERRRFLATNRDEILESLWRQVPELVERVYRDLGAVPGQRWGDKYPQYADGRLDPEALSTIDRLFPAGQYVHIIRDPRAAIGSMKQKGWLDLEKATAAWRNHAAHARNFGTSVGLSRYLEVRYEALVEDGVATLSKILDFLDLPPDPGVDAYLEGEEVERSPVSYPIGTPGTVGEAAWRERLNVDEVRRVEDDLGDLMAEFGYGRASS